MENTVDIGDKEIIDFDAIPFPNKRFGGLDISSPQVELEEFEKITYIQEST